MNKQQTSFSTNITTIEGSLKSAPV